MLQAKEARFTAPNISLNTFGNVIGVWELHIVALIGVILQLGVLVFDAVVAYYYKWGKGPLPVASYAYPLTLIGTIGLVVGMFQCAYIVETSTVEFSWRISQGSFQKSSNSQATQRI